MVGPRSNRPRAYLRSGGPYLAMPGVVLLGLLAVLGPDIWGALYASAKFCRAYMEETSLFDVMPGLAVVLVSGPVVVALFATVRELLRLRLMSKSLARAGCSAVRGSPGYPIFQVEDSRPFAFCHGLLRPRIYLSTGLTHLLTPQELRSVMLHEETHARRRDPLRVFIARVVAAGLFALPLARLVRDRYLAGLEISADREVVSRHGVAPLAAALAKLLAAEPSGPMGASVSRFSPSKQRIDQLAGAPDCGRTPLIAGGHLLASAVTVIISGFLAAGAIYGVNEFLLSTSFCRVPMV